MYAGFPTTSWCNASRSGTCHFPLGSACNTQGEEMKVLFTQSEMNNSLNIFSWINNFRQMYALKGVITAQKGDYPPDIHHASHLTGENQCRVISTGFSRWLWPGNRTFLEVAITVVTWWIVAFLPSVYDHGSRLLLKATQLRQPKLITAWFDLGKKKKCLQCTHMPRNTVDFWTQCIWN